MLCSPSLKGVIILHKKIHAKALAAATRYKRSEVELIEVLQQVWTAKTFYQLGCRSMFQYSVSKLGLSPEVTNIFNKITKKTLNVSGFKEQIECGNISLSNASRICSVITEENKERWFELAKGPKAKLEREIALASPKQAIREKSRMKVFGNEVRVELTYGVSKAHMEKITRAKDLLSQKLGRGATLEEVSEATLDLYLEKNDPLKKPCPGTRRGRVTIKRAVHHSNDSQCSHIDENGERCPERRHLHIHHIQPRARGGTNDLDNLTILGSGHHHAHHRSG